MVDISILEQKSPVVETSGYRVSEAAQKLIPEKFRFRTRCYLDSDWWIPVVFLPDNFRPEEIADAKEAMLERFPIEYHTYFGKNAEILQNHNTISLAMWAKRNGYRYVVAWRLWNNGKLPVTAYQKPNGHIRVIVDE